MLCDEFTHSLEVEAKFDHAECSVYTPVTRNDGVVMGRDDFLNTVLRDNDFVVRPQSTILEVLPLVVLELQCG